MNSMGRRSKKLQLYLSKKLRRSWLLSACKYPKTPSFAVSRHNDDDAADAAAAAAHGATLSDVDRFLHENFHSLYIRDPSDVTDAASSPPGSTPSRAGPLLGPVLRVPRHDVELDHAGPGRAGHVGVVVVVVGGGGGGGHVSGGGGEDDVAAAAVVTFSKDPYEDFRRSMREMVDARRVDASQPLDWDFMEELLFCYLELNDKSVHKYILTAFTDLTVSFRRPRDPAVSADAGTEQRRRRRTRTKAAAAAAAVRL
uniref:Transcription repressor n=1 Tax=Ananas comosus var. bracteatus TaxID=296719 RepID=A0A6V7PGJ0_ANACO|nr:unnamed protein product [Ananas comosus var. bracteatus]